eukprot:m.70910 g.70910  ORF g.70910 m.70910 type:complete len:92 (+) comp8327_c1_seq1:1774-2049(+)
MYLCTLCSSAAYSSNSLVENVRSKVRSSTYSSRLVAVRNITSTNYNNCFSFLFFLSWSFYNCFLSLGVAVTRVNFPFLLSPPLISFSSQPQ